MDILTLIIPVTLFFSILLLVLGLSRGGKSTTPTGDMESRLQAFRDDPNAEAVEDEPSGRLRQRSYSGLPVLSAFLAGFKGSEKVALGLEKAGVPLRVGEYYMIRWGVGGLFFLVPFVFGIGLFQLVIALVLGVLGYVAPAIWMSSKRNSRLSKIEGQLVDMLGLVSNSLKSGYGLMQSFEFASKQMHAPIAIELKRMLRESNLGMSAEDALTALGERIDSKDFDMVMTAINIQRAVGGNLAEILDKVAYTMRERERIRGEINTLTAQQRLTGIVIGGLPVFMFAVFMAINPDYMSLLFTEVAGRIILITAVTLEILGYFVIKRVMAIEV